MKAKHILSLSGIYEKEQFPDADFYDFTALSGTRFFCSDEAAVDFRRMAASICPGGIRLIDSGDYHYLSLFSLEQIQEPFMLLLLDHHSDMQESAFGGDVLSCGSWVLTALNTLPNCKKVLLVGASEGGMDGQEAFPDRVACIPEEKVHCLPQIINQFPDLPVFFSFDRDFLSVDDYKTDWSQGTISLSDTLAVLEKALCGKKLIGIDLCGAETLDESRDNPLVAVKNRKADLKMLSFCESLLKDKNENAEHL